MVEMGGGLGECVPTGSKKMRGEGVCAESMDGSRLELGVRVGKSRKFGKG